MSRHAARRAATAAAAAARRTARNDPTARGADWRGATVATVDADGTITTTDGVIARRTEAYQAPAAGDLIHISRSGAGNWRAEGRLAGPSASIGTWTNIPLASGFTTPHTAFGVAQYRLITAWGTQRVELRGSVNATTSVTAQTNFSTALPSAARPAVTRSWIGRRNYSADTKGVAAMEIQTSGVMSVFGSASPSQTDWFALDGCYYDL